MLGLLIVIVEDIHSNELFSLLMRIIHNSALERISNSMQRLIRFSLFEQLLSKVHLFIQERVVNSRIHQNNNITAEVSSRSNHVASSTSNTRR